jgi:hypothetical protein
MKRWLSIFAVVLVAAAASRPTDLTARPRSVEGDYNVIIRGMFKGGGVARVGANRLSIDGDVTDLKGSNGELQFKITIKRDNHFSGPGNVLGQKAIFTGRIDTPDDNKELAIRGTRIALTFKTDDGRYGRIIGYIPNDPRLPKDHPRRGK